MRLGLRRLAGLVDLSLWPWPLLLGLAGAAATVLAFATVNLFSEAMANLSFVRRHGWMAFEVGAGRQMAELGLAGALALVAYLVFKFCEIELSTRYRAWIARRRPPPPPEGGED